ncbi:universal stress protein [Anaerobacillus alkalidiazotrophicus]|uniref:Universal stress protein n=1 Tax=Anaerobacillus alkalidiazotrophicus TaxID=472963 RepID=A0A1S2M9J3_9BACI|nr:universal stress protein [Anaerobacillus alkalidiazotrophicus]OIJ21408.1 universal stress protein [Anaerobacillus alkalidiazotrophicus]
MFQNILLAADGSAHSLRAANNAIHLLTNKETGSIKVVYVVDGSTSKSDVLHNKDSKDIAEKRREKVKDILSLLETSNINHDYIILHGDPGETIVDYANNNSFDCLVIGSRGLNRLQSMVLGGVSHKVAKRAKCPVMIIK